MKKRVVLALSLLLAAASLTACGGSAKTTTAAQADSTTAAASETAAEKETGKASGENITVRIGATPSPHAEILEEAKPLLEKEGITLDIKVYNDYVQPNLAVDQGKIDANYFQHRPYLDDFNQERGTHVVSAGSIHYEPFGIYAGKSEDLENIKDGAQIAVPNDTTNEARALLLLQDNGVIRLRDGAGLNATKQDIVENPHKVEILEVEAAQIPRSVDSVDFAAMNGNYAIQAGVKPSDALAQESADSEAAQTYANIIAVSEKNQDADWAKKLVEVLQSQKIQDFINEKYQGGVVPMQ